jgi:mannosyltransferase OCH1-like enzyme
MYIGPIILNRFAKFTGFLIKGFSYFFHFIFKNKRFKIPEYSAPFIKGKKSLIPKIIWQTNYSNNVTLPVYVNYLFNRLMSLDWEYRYVSTEARLEFIRTHASERYSQAFEQLTDGAAQADFWRLFVP